MEEKKKAAARAAAAFVKDGMVVGLGTGSTAKHAVDAVGELVRAGLKIVGVPTSNATEQQARSLHIPLAGLGEISRLDLTIDGADEVDPSLQLVKGAGGALFREKLVAMASDKFLVVVDDSKLVTRLGTRMPLPVEVVCFGWEHTAKRVADVLGGFTLRMKDGKPYLTDNHAYILDCPLGETADLVALQNTLKAIPGVIETGLFLNMASRVFVASASGVKELP